MPGPLEGVRVVELVGLGPAPFCGMVLADLGADVIQIDRPASAGQFEIVPPRFDLHRRGKRSIAVDLKTDDGAAVVLKLVAESDVLIEGFRPGVAERLGIGPAAALAANQRLVYGRMTGWGQTGPYADAAGHDIDYIAISGLLHPIGDAGSPTVPLNMIGDFGGGGMVLAMGVLAALVAARETGVGQVVDAAMVDGSALLSTSIHGLAAAGLWEDRRASNLLDGGAPFYSVYETSDGGHVAVGALEPQFFGALVDRLGLSECPPQLDRDRWPEMRALFAEKFRSGTRSHWVEVFEGVDGCVAPVRSLSEAPTDPHLQARGTFVEVSGVVQPAPAPRFSATPAEAPAPPSRQGQHSEAVLSAFGYSQSEISKLVAEGTVTNWTEES